MAAAALLIAALADAIPWTAFVIVLVPLLVLLSRTLRVFGLVAAAAFIGLLTLSPTVWLPLRQIEFTGAPPTLKNGALPTRVAAYVLSTDDKGMSLLIDDPRAVVDVTKSEVKREMPLCVPEESSWRVLTTRASQELGVDVDPHSPYPTCETEPEPES